ncbi:MAG TPA: Fic family protein [Myxococcota bacterium]|nr:Fic family protein [Myxococcota bacterium]
MARYTQTHPWLTFTFDLQRAPPILWLLLGEARSKIEHLAGVPLRPSTAQEMRRISLVRGALATTAIEGNTLSEEEANRYLEDQSSLPKSRRYMGEEFRNVVLACNAIWQRFTESDDEELTLERILEYNRQVLLNTAHSDEVTPGEWRAYAVGVGRYRAPDAAEVPELMRRFVDWFASDAFRQEPFFEDKAGPATMSILGAILAHLYFAWIHPFGDGNGRTARLLEFALLLRADVPTVAAHLLSNHYNDTRPEYYRQLERASATHDPIPFVVYALQGFVDGLRAQNAKVRKEQLEVSWLNYVHEAFHDQTGEVAKRRRDVVLALSTQPAPVHRDSIPLLSPTLARQYAALNPKTLGRDLQILAEMGLVEEVDKVRWQARIRDIESFIPARRTRVRTGR